MELNGVQRKFIDNKLDSLSKSKFRSSFKLKKKDLDYISNKGYDVIEEHAYRFIRERLALKIIDNDGKQTPMRGHPVFIAQHATACCCRGCLYKWHHIEKDKELSEKEIRFIVCLIIEWIKRNER
ncbi:MAG: DUF4186 domain-containing protein [Bacilli bacterium]|nr:DUF4186 domain-containing protein [Bacilli bacterium]